MKVCYNKLWKLLIDKEMKKVSYEWLLVQAKVPLPSSVKTRMSPFQYCWIYVNIFNAILEILWKQYPSRRSNNNE